MVAPSLFVNKQEIIDVADEVTKQFAPDVIFIGFRIANDWTGKPSLFYRILLSDEAAKKGRISEVGQRVEKALDDRLQPYQRWDLYPYHDYRSQSEQAEIQDPAWERHVFSR